MYIWANMSRLSSDDVLLRKWAWPYSLKDQLRDPISFLDLEVGLGVVEQQDLNLATVVRIDDAGAGVNEVLGRKPAAWSDATVCRWSFCQQPGLLNRYRNDVLDAHMFQPGPQPRSPC